MLLQPPLEAVDYEYLLRNVFFNLIKASLSVVCGIGSVNDVNGIYIHT